jgi:hypothetical protein
VLRHRLLRNFSAESERISTDEIVEKLVANVRVPASRLG